jgi:hypothetical protein
MMMKMTWTIGMTYAFSRYIIIVVVIYYKIAKMKTITIKRRRRMTKHRKGMTKPRKSNRRIKNRKHKTRRQSGGGGWKSFIEAQDNPRSGSNSGSKGIDVKHKTGLSGQHMWLIGGDGFFDATFGELKAGAKDKRYQQFITALEYDNAAQKPPLLLNFTNPSRGRIDDSSKGIWLSHDQFCRLFINGSLNYPELMSKFHRLGYKCPGTSGPSGPSAASSVAPPSAAVAPPSAAVAPPSAAPPSSAPVTQQYVPPSAAPNYFAQLNQIKEMKLENVTDQKIANALTSTHGIVNQAVEILLNTAAGPFTGQQRARGGVAAQPDSGSAHATPSAAPAPSDCEIKFVELYSDTYGRVIGNVSYTEFERRITSKTPLVVINEVCTPANIPFIGNAYEKQIHSRLIDWAEGMIRCNQHQLPSFERPRYTELKAQSSRMKLTLSVNDRTITNVDGDGWCLYRALTEMYLQKDPASITKLRQFAQMITLTIFHTLDYLNYAKNYATNEYPGVYNTNADMVERMPVCGVHMNIGIEDMLQLISIPNLDDIKIPCLYPDITWMIGQIAALILRKNIFVFSNPQNMTAQYSGTQSTAPGDQIYLLVNDKHFSVINFTQQPIVSFD